MLTLGGAHPSAPSSAAHPLLGDGVCMMAGGPGGCSLAQCQQELGPPLCQVPPSSAFGPAHRRDRGAPGAFQVRQEGMWPAER